MKFATFFLAATLSLVLSSCPQNNDQSKSSESTPKPPKPVNLSPLDEIKISTAKADIEVCQEIGKLIETREAEHETWSVFAVDLKSSEAVCSVNPRTLVRPASTLKIITTAAALDTLGSEFKSKTSVYAKGVKNGKAAEIVLYGRGAPDLDVDAIEELAKQVRDSGVSSVTGEVIGDDSYFKGDPYGDGWTWNELQWYYGAPASALSFQKNLSVITLQNGRVSASDDDVTVSSDVNPKRDIEAVGVRRKPGSNAVYVWGEGNSLRSRLAVIDPVRSAANSLKMKLSAAGVKVSTEVAMRDWTNKTNLEEYSEVASVFGRPLSETVKETNKESVNLFSELMLRELGKKFGKSAPDPNPRINRLRGDELAGAAFLEFWLEGKTGRGKRLAVHDGSGLSAYNLITAESLVRVLAYTTNADFSKDFYDSLPISGTDGTLKARLTGMKGRVRAKTGTVKYVNSLAGFISNRDSQLAFAVIVNNETTRNDSNATIDSIVRALAR